MREIVYQIDRDDRIDHVNEEWDRFAAENSGEAALSHRVLGRSIWHFVGDAQTRLLYQHILLRVREGRCATFEFRCDSPARERLLSMSIAALPELRIELRTRLVSTRPRTPPGLLQDGRRQSGELLCVCAWCTRVRVAAEWLDPEQATKLLRLFAQGDLPGLTHGICPDCLARLYPD